MHYYSHHIGDFIRDTANLNDHQCMTYLRLCWKYYDDEEAITGDIEDIAFAMRSDEKTVRLLLKHYFVLEGENWHHTRIDKELSKFKSKSANAKKSANARWNNANALRTDCDGNAKRIKNDANQEPITNNHSKGGSDERPTKPKQVSLSKYLETCKESGSEPIPQDSIVFQNADKLQIPDDYIHVAWKHFKDHWTESKPRATKADWISTFNNCLKSDGYGAYAKSQAGEWYLTTKGKNTLTLLGGH